MRIHSDILTPHDVSDAAKLAGVWIFRNARHGSRIRSGAIDFILESPDDDAPPANFGGDYRATTWDQWGIALAHLFALDPDAIVPNVYESGEHYHWATGGRFANGARPEIHKRHKWIYEGECVTGAYSVSRCKCGAITRRMAGSFDGRRYVVRPFATLGA